MTPFPPSRSHPRAKAYLAGAGAAFLLSGCASLPTKSDLRPIAPAESFAASRSLPATPSAEWPSDGWWTAYGDPQLNELIEEGLKGATDVRVAEARFERAQAVVRQSGASLFPSLSGSAQGGVTQQSGNYLFPRAFAPRGWPNYGQGALSLSWDLDFWGRNRAALAAARSDAEAARAETAAARLAVSAGIASAYADLAGLYAEQDSASEAVRVCQQTWELMRGRRDQGLENNGTVEQAASALASAQGELAALTESIALARNQIAELLGAGPDRGLAITRPVLRNTVSSGLPADLPADLIGRRPDIVAARLRAQAAASRIKETHAAFYPNINLSGLIGLQALGIDSLFKSGSDYGSAAPALSLPIFDGGRLRGQYRAAESDYKAAVAQYDGALAKALHDVADAATNSRALAERLARAQEAERSAHAAWMVANNRYRGGLATYLDVLTAENALISTRRSLASLQTRAFTVDVALIRALGGGYRS